MSATYPSLAANPSGSFQKPVEDLVTDQWPNGNTRGRSYYTAGKYEWQLLHDILSDANRATLKAFYDANRLLTFDYVSPWDGITYHNVGFLAPIEYKGRDSSTLYWDVTVKLRQMF